MVVGTKGGEITLVDLETKTFLSLSLSPSFSSLFLSNPNDLFSLLDHILLRLEKKSIMGFKLSKSLLYRLIFYFLFYFIYFLIFFIQLCKFLLQVVVCSNDCVVKRLKIPSLITIDSIKFPRIFFFFFLFQFPSSHLPLHSSNELCNGFSKWKGSPSFSPLFLLFLLFLFFSFSHFQIVDGCLRRLNRYMPPEILPKPPKVCFTFFFYDCIHFIIQYFVFVLLRYEKSQALTMLGGNHSFSVGWDRISTHVRLSLFSLFSLLFFLFCSSLLRLTFENSFLLLVKEGCVVYGNWDKRNQLLAFGHFKMGFSFSFLFLALLLLFLIHFIFLGSRSLPTD